MVLRVVVRRGEIAESSHRVQAVACDAGGVERLSADPAGYATTFRSAAKPFQLLPLVERGHAERWGWSDEQLAVMAASHTGSDYHIGLVTGILARLGLDERHLACGYHEPADPASRDLLIRDPGRRSALYNNCSGKHAGMLCLALSEGWPVEGYERADHPLQQLMRRVVAESCGMAPEDLVVAVDGCSVSVFGLPLKGMARAYARLASARPAGDARERALARIRGAMQSHPRAVSGEGRLSFALTEVTGGRLVAKGGAEGLQCVAVPDAGIGLALKCEDGDARALGPMTVALLDHLGALSAEERRRLETWARPRLHNCAGLEVGVLEAVLGS